jgi:hypothetical protein
VKSHPSEKSYDAIVGRAHPSKTAKGEAAEGGDAKIGQPQFSGKAENSTSTRLRYDRMPEFPIEVHRGTQRQDSERERYAEKNQELSDARSQVTKVPKDRAQHIKTRWKCKNTFRHDVCK